MKAPESIRIVDLASVDISMFDAAFVGCVILTHDNKILLQRRGNNWKSFPGRISTFGGKIELGEKPEQALKRELHEELGANVMPSDIISLGVITEAYTNHSELIYIYFWHDISGSITGCYEGEAVLFGAAEALQHSNVMDDVKWMLGECKKKKLV